MSNDQYHLALNIPCYLSIWISYKTRKATKKIFMLLYIYPCYPCTFRYCTNGRGSVPSLISKEHHLDAPRQQEPLVLFAKNCLSTKPTNICTAQWSINLNFIQNFKIAKKMHSWYAYVTHTCLDVATKTRKLQKKCIHDMLMLLTHV